MYQLQDAGKIQPDEQVMASSGCESGNSCVSSQQTSDTFLSDSMGFVRTSLDYYIYMIPFNSVILASLDMFFPDQFPVFIYFGKSMPPK